MIQIPSNLSTLRNLWRVANNVEPHAPNSFRLVRNLDDSETFYVFGLIGANDEDASNFVKTVSDSAASTINLHINSPGGFVFDAVAMYDALSNSVANVNVEINGLAASAASFLAMAGNSVRIADAGRMMMHDAQGIAMGGPDDMREYGDLLESVSNDIAGIYAKRAGGKPEAWRSAMKATTWYNSSQAIDSKLADGLTSSTKEGPDNRTRLIQARARVLISLGGK